MPLKLMCISISPDWFWAVLPSHSEHSCQAQHGCALSFTELFKWLKLDQHGQVSAGFLPSPSHACCHFDWLLC